MLILCSAILTGAEAAYFSLGRARLKHVAPRDEDEPVGEPKTLIERPHELLVTLLVGITVINIGAAAIAATIADSIFGPTIGLFVEIVVLVFVLTTFGEVLPMTLAVTYPERFLAVAGRPVAWLGVVLAPVRAALAGLTALMVRMVSRGRTEQGMLSEEELRTLVDVGASEGVVEREEREMIHKVFELEDTLVRSVMVPRTDMVFIEADKTVEQALSLALRSGFSRIPVVGENEDDVVGIAYLKDVVAWSHEHPGAEASEKIATVIRPASYVPDSKPVDELLRQMQAQRSHVAIVIDEYGGTAGLVTIEDILEEIVGEITDEYDNEQPPVEWLADGSARVTARLSATELGELFGINLEDEDVETVAGLLAHALGRVPIAGSTAAIRGLRLTAENLAGRRNKIGTVLVKRESDPAP